MWRMTRDHDACHHLVAVSTGAPWSTHLAAIACGQESPEDDREERIVFLLQRAINAGRVVLNEMER